jgi:hypothetical protein
MLSPGQRKAIKPLEASASNSITTKRLKQAQDIEPEQLAKDFKETDRLRLKKRQRSWTVDGSHASNKRVRCDSTNHDKDAAPGVVKDNMQDFAVEQSLNELSTIRYSQEDGVDICSEVAQQDQAVRSSGIVARKHSLRAPSLIPAIEWSKIILSTSMQWPHRYKINWAFSDYVSLGYGTKELPSKQYWTRTLEA